MSGAEEVVRSERTHCGEELLFVVRIRQAGNEAEGKRLPGYVLILEDGRGLDLGPHHGELFRADGPVAEHLDLPLEGGPDLILSTRLQGRADPEQAGQFHGRDRGAD